MQILIPITSNSVFFPKEEFFFSKPLVEVAGRPMIELVVANLKQHFPLAQFLFVVDREDVVEYSIDKILKLAVGPDARVIERNGPTKGALCSCLLAIDYLNREEPIAIVNGDQVIAANLRSICNSFERSGADAGLVTFPASHPRWSYATLDETDSVVQLTEKRVVSRDAIAGFYYFARTSDFLECAQNAILNDTNTDGSFYISASLNELLLKGGRIVHHQIDARDYHSFYSPSRIDQFERSDYAKQYSTPDKRFSTKVNVVIPAGGEGSRFQKAGWRKPKPFIDVNGEMMLLHVLRNVSPKSGSSPTVLLRKEHIEKHPECASALKDTGASIVSVEQLTQGTACTVLLARSHFDNDAPLLIANSDQLVDFEVDDYINDCLSRNLDGSILVFRDSHLDPKWSFAKLDAEGLVAEVAEKKPISDLATVGIYFFTRGSEFVSAAVDMIARDERVNGEFYTCPIYNYMIRAGARIGVYEVPETAMHGLGIPEDLDAYLAKTSGAISVDAP